MVGLIEFLAHNLVDEPESVEVRPIRDDRYATVVGLRVAESDLGKVIGRQGRVVRGLRALVKAAATRKGTRVDLDVV